MSQTIDAYSCCFIWSGNDGGRVLSLVPWDVLSTPKRFGGLSILDTRLTNVALLGKLIWKLFHEPHQPWAAFLSHKYLSVGSVLDDFCARGSSYVWQNNGASRKRLHFLGRVGVFV